MKRGLKRDWLLATGPLLHVEESSPMKRGLKLFVEDLHLALGFDRGRVFPDEEGTETALALAVAALDAAWKSLPR